MTETTHAPDDETSETAIATDAYFSDDSFFDGEPFLDDEPEVLDLHEGLTVAAVMVVHDGDPWLSVALSALRAQDRPVDAVAAVDTGSQDSSAQVLAELVGADRVLTLDRSAGFGEAVAKGVRHAGDTDWVWILHDDCAPRADALRRLLDRAKQVPDAAVIGPKVLGWADRTHLLEVGITTARGGRRETGLERSERDQGQHDVERDVLAVGSAGMLVRRDVWDELGGLDPALPLFRDDIDFGWRANLAGHRVTVAPRAVVHHAEASTHRRRVASAVADHPARADRASALHVVLANSPTWLVPILWVRLLLGCLARALGYLIGKDVAATRDELAAMFEVLFRPGRIAQARRARRATITVPRRQVGRLLAPPGAQVRMAVETIGGVLAGGDRPGTGPATSLNSPGDDDDLVTGSGSAVWTRHLRRPGAIGVLVLLLVALVASRNLLGGGRLLGGALLPAPDGISAWWRTFVEAWHPVSIGSPSAAPPTLPILAALGMPAAGRAPSVVDIVLLLAVPLAFASAFLCLRGVTRSRVLRAWAAFAYALLPAVTGAIASGRLGTAVVAILLPPLARALAHALGLGRTPPSGRAMWGTALLLAVAGAFVPLLWVFVLILGTLAVFTVSRDRLSRITLAVVLLVPLVLWLPWSFRLVTDPELLLLEAGASAPGLADPALPAWSVLGLDPGGPGTAAWWIGLGVLFAALSALLRGARRPTIVLAWAVAGIALAVAMLLTLFTLTPPGSIPVAAWPGTATLVAGAALLLAAVIGNERGDRRLSATDFSWRQVLAATVTATAILTPVVWGVTWMDRGADGPLVRTDPVLLPAFVTAQSAGPDRPRTLVLRTEPDRVAYAVLRASGPRLGDGEVVPEGAALAGLDEVVADLASGRGGVEAARLSTYAIEFVQVAAPVPQDLADRLDAVPALSRIGAPEGGALWRVGTLSARARLVPQEGAPTALPAQEITVSGEVPADWDGGRLVLADPTDGGWSARAGGVELEPVVVDGWAQGFEVPASASGEIAVTYSSTTRTLWLILAGSALIVVVVLALPARRRDALEGQDA